MFRAVHRSSSGALNCICSLWFICPYGDQPLPRLSLGNIFWSRVVCVDATFHAFKISTRDEVISLPLRLLYFLENIQLLPIFCDPEPNLVSVEKRSISAYVLNRTPIPQSSNPNPSHYISLSTPHQLDNLC